MTSLKADEFEPPFKQQDVKKTPINSAAEKIEFSPEAQEAYDKAWELLRQNGTFFAPLPTLVSIDEVIVSQAPGSNDGENSSASNNARRAGGDGAASHVLPQAHNAANPHTSISLIRRDDPNRDLFETMHFNRQNRSESNIIAQQTSQRELELALEKLENLEKEESALMTKSSLTRQLTELVTGEVYLSSTDAMNRLEILGKTVPRRVCQHPFRKNDIVWVCRTCQADETCVLCHNCFSQSNHEGHDVAFYHAQAGGCCDCGDPDGR